MASETNHTRLGMFVPQAKAFHANISRGLWHQQKTRQFRYVLTRQEDGRGKKKRKLVDVVGLASFQGEKKKEYNK